MRRTIGADSLRDRYDDSAPTFGEIDISLSLRTTSRFCCAQVAGVVQRLEGHARRSSPPSPISAIATPRLAAGAAGARHAERRRDRGAGVAGAEVVVLRLGRGAGTSTMPPSCADAVEVLAPAGEHLVRIALVADVEDEAVARRVEDVVERGDQLDGAEARREVAAGLRDTRSMISSRSSSATSRTDFARQRAQIGGALDAAAAASPFGSLIASPHGVKRASSRSGSARSPMPRSLEAALDEQAHRRARARPTPRARAPASRLRRSSGVEQVVGDLEGDADRVAEAAQALELVADRAAEPRAADDRRREERGRSCARARTRSRAASAGGADQLTRSSTCPPTSWREPAARGEIARGAAQRAAPDRRSPLRPRERRTRPRAARRRRAPRVASP